MEEGLQEVPAEEPLDSRPAGVEVAEVAEVAGAVETVEVVATVSAVWLCAEHHWHTATGPSLHHHLVACGLLDIALADKQPHDLAAPSSQPRGAKGVRNHNAILVGFQLGSLLVCEVKENHSGLCYLECMLPAGELLEAAVVVGVAATCRTDHEFQGASSRSSPGAEAEWGEELGRLGEAGVLAVEQ